MRHLAETLTIAMDSCEGAPSTRELLLTTAERLFAEHGIEAVTLTQIQEAAGQRNASAINYHFGGREALVRAIVDFRAQTVNARRMALLDDLERHGRSDDVVALVDAMVRPLAEQVQAGNHYVGFLARVTNEVTAQRPAPMPRDPANASLLRVGRRLRQNLPPLPHSIVRTRLALASDLAIHTLALHDRLAVRTQRSPPNLEHVIADLVDALVGLLQAPSRRSEQAARNARVND